METFVSQDNWQIKTLELPNAERYIHDLSNIEFATTGFVHAWETNLFFDEACQLIVNAIRLFQNGYFDCAFYSLRQSIEVSIGTIYLTANPNKEDEWKKLCNGFESGAMSRWIKENEPTFKDIREKMGNFFENVRNVQFKMNKYIHKQGYATFYKVTNNPFLSQQKDISDCQILFDFESFLKVCIGAVSVFRLSIDAFPVVLMEEDMLHRAGDIITEPYTQEFVDSYIGKENIDAYKTTRIYNDFYESLRRNERQNDAVFNLIHYQYYNRDEIKDYEAQLHLCSYTDKVAICLFSISDKISRVFVDGIHWYSSNVKSISNEESVTWGNSYFEDFFSNVKRDYNIVFHNVFLSRCLINDNFTYFEHNDTLAETEIECVRYIAAELSDYAGQKEKNLSFMIQ
jgi:hypothetical protein